MPDLRTMTRRGFVLSPALGAIAGCGPMWLDPSSISGSSTAAMRIVTPWGQRLRERFETALAEWGTKNGTGPIRIDWLPVRDDELAPESVFRLLRFADMILGGRPGQSLVRDSPLLAHAPLVPLRVPVIRSMPTPGASQEIPPASEFAGNRPGPARESAISAGEGLLLSDNPLAPLDQTYFLALFEDAPDQAAGYARWIRLAGSSRSHGGTDASARRARLALAELDRIDRSAEKPWNGGPGTAKILAISESGPVHWPESAFWRASAGSNGNLRLVLDFCRESGWLASHESIAPDSSPPRNLHAMLADIVRIDCVSAIRNAWRALKSASGDHRTEVETYLTARPPWPPASILKLRQERGFEYVVALVEQLSDDASQRNWLIREFGEPESEIDLRRLESAESGNLARSIRFRGWLRAEWVAWLNQRCRRAQRYIVESASDRADESALSRPGGPSRS